MEHIMASQPLELVHIDYLCLEPGKGKEENALVVMDHFRHYAQAYVTQSQMAQTMAKALCDNLIVHYRLPEKILLDQAVNYWGPRNLGPSHITPRQTASGKDLTPP